MQDLISSTFPQHSYHPDCTNLHDLKPAAIHIINNRLRLQGAFSTSAKTQEAHHQLRPSQFSCPPFSSYVLHFTDRAPLASTWDQQHHKSQRTYTPPPIPHQPYLTAASPSNTLSSLTPIAVFRIAENAHKAAYENTIIASYKDRKKNKCIWFTSL